MCVVDHGREVMTYEEIEKIQSEIKLKLVETVTDRGLDYIAKSISLKKNLENKHDYHICIDGKSDGTCSMECQATGGDLAMACYNLMTSQKSDDFYKYLKLLIVIHEMNACDAIGRKQVMSKTNPTAEEVDVFRTMAKMSPEERAEILKDLKK